MKLNSILKLSSLAMVSLGLVSTVALTSTSCSGGLNSIQLIGEIKTDGQVDVKANTQIGDLLTLTAYDTSTVTEVVDAESATAYSLAAETATIKVIHLPSMTDPADNKQLFEVTTKDVAAKSYEFKGFYITGNSKDTSNTKKYHMITIKFTVVA
ncbi:MAG: hypothetical protein LBV22_03150 [Mycoplasmataceae bacterium]|jgi:hypothetical protein|nr:hypothetical protein [Mycoplasmataceae bacterium]